MENRKYRVDIFPGDGQHNRVFFGTENAARVYAIAARTVYPGSAVFVLREICARSAAAENDAIYEILEQVM